ARAQEARADLHGHRRDRRLSHRDQRHLAHGHPPGEGVRRAGHRRHDLGRGREEGGGTKIEREDAMADPTGPGAKSPGALFDVHCAAACVTHDVDATMATMSDRPHITNVPTMTGGLGREAVRQFYDSWFVGHLPEDWTVE